MTDEAVTQQPSCALSRDGGGRPDPLQGRHLPRPAAALAALSADNAFGFLDICHQNDRKRTKPFYAKFTPDGEKKQVRLPQSNSATAEEAACKLAIYNQTKQEIHMIEYHKKRRSSDRYGVEEPVRGNGTSADGRRGVKFDAGDVDMGEADALTSESLWSEMV